MDYLWWEDPPAWRCRAGVSASEDAGEIRFAHHKRGRGNRDALWNRGNKLFGSPPFPSRLRHSSGEVRLTPLRERVFDEMRAQAL